MRLVPCYMPMADCRLPRSCLDSIMSPSHFAPQPQRQRFRVAKRRRRALYAVFAILLVTGLVWLAVHWAHLEPEVEAPWQAWSMKLHGAAGFASLFIVGTIWTSHIRLAWQRGRNRLVGALFGGTMTLLVLTGYGLYYFNGENVRGLTEWAHWIGGMVLGLLFWLHRSRGRHAMT